MHKCEQSLIERWLQSVMHSESLFYSIPVVLTILLYYYSLIITPQVASDLIPIRGYNKRYFGVYSILIGVLGSIALLVLYHPNSADEAISAGPTAVQKLTDLLVLAFTAISYQSATLDILGEGKYSEFMRETPESGSSIISFKFAWSLAGGIVTQMYVGPLSDLGYFHVLFWIALGLCLVPLLPTLMVSRDEHRALALA